MSAWLGPYAALMQQTELGARQIVETSMKIAASLCVFTNDRLTLEEIES